MTRTLAIEASCIKAIYIINEDKIIYTSEYFIRYNADTGHYQKNAILSHITIVFMVSGVIYAQDINVHFDKGKLRLDITSNEGSIVIARRGYFEIIKRDIKKVASELVFYMDLI